METFSKTLYLLQTPKRIVQKKKKVTSIGSVSGRSEVQDREAQTYPFGLPPSALNNPAAIAVSAL